MQCGQRDFTSTAQQLKSTDIEQTLVFFFFFLTLGCLNCLLFSDRCKAQQCDLYNVNWLLSSQL